MCDGGPGHATMQQLAAQIPGSQRGKERQYSYKRVIIGVIRMKSVEIRAIGIGLGETNSAAAEVNCDFAGQLCKRPLHNSLPPGVAWTP